MSPQRDRQSHELKHKPTDEFSIHTNRVTGAFQLTKDRYLSIKLMLIPLELKRQIGDRRMRERSHCKCAPVHTESHNSLSHCPHPYPPPSESEKD